jgi:hypothetical protein
MVAALIVFSDYSSVVIQSESEEFEKFCALLPPPSARFLGSCVIARI